jgi:hypothetical protein
MRLHHYCQRSAPVTARILRSEGNRAASLYVFIYTFTVLQGDQRTHRAVGSRLRVWTTPAAVQIVRRLVFRGRCIMWCGRTLPTLETELMHPSSKRKIPSQATSVHICQTKRCHLLQDSIICQTTRCHVLQDKNIHSQRCTNIKSCTATRKQIPETVTHGHSPTNSTAKFRNGRRQ